MAAALKRPAPEFDITPAPLAPVAPAAQSRSLLRFITCGSVDDGKSTLLGRLLYETGAVFEDQLEALTRDSQKFGTTGKDLDYALLLDGLSAEREQGITIDVAYRYFSTPRRAFIAADTPGHEQYTRNMATGASTADVAIILVDARKGLLPQTRRHSYITAMLGVRQVIVAVNKMDLVGYSEDTFRQIERDYRALAARLGFTEVHLVPLSARMGDNVVPPSTTMPWYDGPPLLTLLETIEPTLSESREFRFPVQWVNRPNLDFRGYSGTVASGNIAVGATVTVLPRGQSTTISGITGPDGAQTTAHAGQAITLTLAHEVDMSRGDVLVAASTARPVLSRIASVRLLALNEQPLSPGRNYILRLGTASTTARIIGIDHQIDVHDYAPLPATTLAMNAIGQAQLRFETAIVTTTYAECPTLGALLLIDPQTNETVALGIIDGIGEPAALPLKLVDTPIARLRKGLVRSGLISDGADDSAALRFISWRIVSALLLAGIVWLASGAPGVALIAGLTDLILRRLARIAHDRISRKVEERLQSRADAALSIDGGGI